MFSTSGGISEEFAWLDQQVSIVIATVGTPSSAESGITHLILEQP
jgi:hypothetical protein